MAFFVFVLGSYYPESDANVTCGKNVIEVLRAQQNDVVCICGTSGNAIVEEYDGMEVHRLHHNRYDMKLRSAESSVRKKCLQIRHLLKSAFMLPFFPVTELSFARKMNKELERINEEKQIDCIVSIFRPFETIYAATVFKKKHSSCHTIGVFLDVQKEANTPLGLPRPIFRFLCDRGEKKYFKTLDSILVPKCSYPVYAQKLFNDVREKIRYIDFPVLKLSGNFNINRRNDNKTIIYAGSTNKSFRNPMFMTKSLIDICKKYPKYHFVMYGKSDVQAELDMLVDNKSFIYKGLVTKEEADLAINEAGILVSIGNADSLLLPSKIFELFATKKKIIHFAKNNNDVAIKYMNLYPNACVIIEDEGLNIATDKISNFIEQKLVEITDEDLLAVFRDATPAAFVSVIWDCMKDRNIES